MTDPQLDVPENIFVFPSGPKISAKEMGEKIKLEVSKAKKRKEEQKPPSKANLTAKKSRIKDDPVLRPEAKIENIAIIRHEDQFESFFIPFSNCQSLKNYFIFQPTPIPC